MPLTIAQAPAEATPAAPKQPEPVATEATTGVTPVPSSTTSAPAAAPSGQSVIRPARVAVATPEAPTTGVTGTTTAVTTKSGHALAVTPEAAAALAVKNSLELGIDATDIRQAEAQVRKAFGLDDFQLTASATYGRRGPIASVSLGEGKSMSLGSADIATEQLQLVKPIYSGKRIERAQDLAVRSLELTKLSSDVTARALDLTAREVAYGVMRAVQLADVAQQQAVAVAAHLDLSKKLADGGVVAQFEVVQANTQLATAQGEVISARTNIENAKARLKRVLTLPQDTELEVTQGVTFEAPPGDVQTLVQQAVEQRPEVAASASGVRLAEANLQLAKSTSALSVSLAAGVTHTKASFGSEPT
ncbi:MAG: TolC family protein, partial [Armatimonadia bacterium]